MSKIIGLTFPIKSDVDSSAEDVKKDKKAIEKAEKLEKPKK